MRPGEDKVDFSEEVGEGRAEIGKGALAGGTECIHGEAGLLASLKKKNTQKLELVILM